MNGLIGKITLLATWLTPRRTRAHCLIERSLPPSSLPYEPLKPWLSIILATLLALACAPMPGQSSPHTAFGRLDAEFAKPGEWPFVGAIVAVWHPEDGPPVVMGAQCTGIKLPGQMILTNAHCTMPKFANGQITLGWTNGFRAVHSDARQLAVNASKTGFIFRGDLAKDLQDLPLLPLSKQPLYRREGMLDFQIFEVSSPVGEASQASLSTVASDDATDGASFLISHPSGLPLLTSSECRRFLRQREYLHDCDTLKGSSGGGIFSSPDGRLVGLHKQGFGSNDPAIFKSRGSFEDQTELVARECADAPPSQLKACQQTTLATAYNKAVPIAGILEDLKTNAGWLWKRIQDGQASTAVPPDTRGL